MNSFTRFAFGDAHQAILFTFLQLQRVEKELMERMRVLQPWIAPAEREKDPPFSPATATQHHSKPPRKTIQAPQKGLTSNALLPGISPGTPVGGPGTGQDSGSGGSSHALPGDAVALSVAAAPNGTPPPGPVANVYRISTPNAAGAATTEAEPAAYIPTAS